MKVSDQLAEFSKAVSVTTLNTMVVELGTVRKNLIDIRKVTNGLRDNASQLNDGNILMLNLLRPDLHSNEH